MEERDEVDLNWEFGARSDPRYWVTFCIGLTMTVICLALLSGDAHWIWALLLFGGFVLLWIGLRALLQNRTRGCFFDPATLVLSWWDNRRPGEALDQQKNINVRNIGAVVVNRSGDTLEIALYDKSGDQVDGFREWCIPSDYNQWIEKLCRISPEIEVRRIDR